MGIKMSKGTGVPEQAPKKDIDSVRAEVDRISEQLRATPATALEERKALLNRMVETIRSYSLKVDREIGEKFSASHGEQWSRFQAEEESSEE